MYRLWDIIVFEFPFRENPTKTKSRPCVIIERNGDEYTLLGITSKYQAQTDYEIIYSRQANLSDISYIMTDYLVHTQMPQGLPVVGNLIKTDRLNILKILNESN